MSARHLYVMSNVSYFIGFYSLLGKDILDSWSAASHLCLLVTQDKVALILGAAIRAELNTRVAMKVKWQRRF